MLSSSNQNIIGYSVGLIIIIITFTSVFYRNSQYNLNGKLVYIAATSLPVCFFATIIMALVEGARIKIAKDNKKLKIFHIMTTIFFGIIPIIILLYLTYSFVSPDCNYKYRPLN
jgi:hypothetical protein